MHDPIVAMLDQYGPQGLDIPISIVEASLGDDSGLVGGAAWEIAYGGR